MGIMANDFMSPEGQVRLLIPDLDEDKPVFTDAELRAYLAIHKGNIKRAAATAIDAIATSTVMILKLVKTDDLTVDGPAVSKELRARAEALREEANADDIEDAMSEGFQIINPIYVPDIWETDPWI